MKLLKAMKKKSCSLTAKYRKWSISIKEAHNYTCQLCNYHNPKNRDKTNKIELHHILRVKNFGIVNESLLMSENNILVVCRKCHFIKIHKNNFIPDNDISIQKNWIKRELDSQNFNNNLQNTINNILKKYDGK